MHVCVNRQAIAETVGTLPEMAAARHIRIVDTATAFDALRRTYRFYEYNAIFETATGDERRLAALRGSEPDPAKIDLLIARPAYHMRGYVPSPVDLELRISPGERPGVLELLRLLGLEAVGSASFGPEVSKLIDIRATTIATPGAAP